MLSRPPALATKAVGAGIEDRDIKPDGDAEPDEANDNTQSLRGERHFAFAPLSDALGQPARRDHRDRRVSPARMASRSCGSMGGPKSFQVVLRFAPTGSPASVSVTPNVAGAGCIRGVMRTTRVTPFEPRPGEVPSVSVGVQLQR